MSLGVYTTPGFVFVTCGGETVVISGVLVAPPGDQAHPLPTFTSHDVPTYWFPKAGIDIVEPSPDINEPVQEERRAPPPTGRSGGGVSTQIADDIRQQIVSLAAPGVQIDTVELNGEPLNKLLSSSAFCEFSSKMPGSYALTVSPRSTAPAEKASVVISNLAPSVLMKHWTPNV
jgi:hypothetical protein